MNRDEKAAVVAEMAGQIETSEAVFAVDYRGLTVPEAAELRTKLRDADASFRVVKNSLTERAADHAGAASLKEFLVGPTALTLVRGDAALAAKTLSDMARALRGRGVLEFKGGLLNGASLTADQVTSIARLPSRQVLEAQLVGTIAAPLVGLVRGLNGLLSGVAIALQQVLEQRGGAPETVAEPEPTAEVVAEPEPVAPAEPEPAVEAEPEAAAEPEPAAAGSSAPIAPPPSAVSTELPTESPPGDSATTDQDSASEDASDA